MIIQFSPVPDGTQWQVLATKEVSTLYWITVNHADLDVEHDPNDVTELKHAVHARALDLLAAGEATVIGQDNPPVSVTSWEIGGSALAREALEFHTQRVTGEAAR